MRKLLCALFLTFVICHRIQDSLLVDSDGRRRVYHGVNAVYKVAPFYPPVDDHFDANDSLADIDFENLRSWGMNVIRLHVAWEAFEPVKGQYNYTYFEQLQKIVRRAEPYNIAILLDAHQDVLSRFFCGEGFPDWAVSRTEHPFPFPVKKDIPVDEKGYPLIEECIKTKFIKYYFAFDATQTFQDLFDNKGGLADSFAGFWGEVAKFFKDEPNVIGYEIINEPIAGNVYHSVLEFLFPNKGNNKNLLPLYQKVSQQIRTHDTEKLVFFEPGTTDYLGGDFADTPGGLQFRDKEVYSYHIYCPLVDSHSLPTNDFGCKLFDLLEFKLKEKHAKGLRVGKFLTEFGAIADDPKGVKELDHILNLVESGFTSWAYWEFKYFADITTQTNPGNLESFYNPEGELYTEKVKTLARPYVTAICGEPVHTSYGSKVLNLIWKVCNLCNGKKTEIFLSEEFYFQKRTVQFKNCPGCTLKQISKSYYEVDIPQTVSEGTKVILNIIDI